MSEELIGTGSEKREGRVSAQFKDRHIGPRTEDKAEMLKAIGLKSIEDLIAKTVPTKIRLNRSLDLPPALSEQEALAELKDIASKNKVFRSFIGIGFHDCVTPPVILRNILENPGWYTQYTPYQPKFHKAASKRF